MNLIYKMCIYEIQLDFKLINNFYGLDYHESKIIILFYTSTFLFISLHTDMILENDIAKSCTRFCAARKRNEDSAIKINNILHDFGSYQMSISKFNKFSFIYYLFII